MKSERINILIIFSYRHTKLKLQLKLKEKPGNTLTESDEKYPIGEVIDAKAQWQQEHYDQSFSSLHSHTSMVAA